MASSAYHRRHNTMAEKRAAYTPKPAPPGFKGAAASAKAKKRNPRLTKVRGA